MNEDLEVPVAYCDTCKDEGPVVIEQVQLNEDAPAELQGLPLTVVYCPGCDQLLNTGEEDIKIKWYTLKDLEGIGWKGKIQND